MLKGAVVLATAVACAEAFAPGASMLPAAGTRRAVVVGPLMQTQRQGSQQSSKSEEPQGLGARLGSLGGGLAGGLGSLTGGLGSLLNKGSQAPAAPPAGTGTQRPVRAGSQLVTPKKAAPAPKKAAPAPKKAAPAARAPPARAPATPRAVPVSDRALTPSPRVLSDEDLPPRWVLPEGFGSPYDRNPPYSEWMPSPLWAREAEIKHGRVAMTAVLGLVVQELAPRGVPFDWYGGEKVLALHDKLVEVGAAWQLLLFIGLFELWWLRRYSAYQLDGSGDYGFLKTYFDPLGLAKDDETFAINRVKETKNGRLAMISFAGIVHHYLITGKGPIEFITAPPLANCVAKASELPGASIAAIFAPGGQLDALCGF